MAVRLQAMHEKYGDQIIIKNIDLNQVPDAANDFPLSFVPAQFMYQADGTPFVPSETTPVQLQRHFLRGTSEHVLTGHVGAIQDEPFEQLILELIND
jgi:thioredoxin 1